MGLVFSLGAVLGALFPEVPPELPAAPKPGLNLGKAHTSPSADQPVTFKHSIRCYFLKSKQV